MPSDHSSNNSSSHSSDQGKPSCFKAYDIRGTVPAEGEMERRSARSRLTEYERRLLERMRNRRSNPPGRLNPPDPNGTGNQGTGR
jgi:hypothetical protein